MEIILWIIVIVLGYFVFNDNLVLRKLMEVRNNWLDNHNIKHKELNNKIQKLEERIKYLEESNLSK